MRVLAVAKQNENGLFISNIIGREIAAIQRCGPTTPLINSYLTEA